MAAAAPDLWSWGGVKGWCQRHQVGAWLSCLQPVRDSLSTDLCVKSILPEVPRVVFCFWHWTLMIKCHYVGKNNVYSVSMFNDIEILFTECKVDKMPLFVLYYFSLVPNTYLSIVSNSPKISLSISLPPFPLHYPPLAQDFSKFQKLPAFLPSPGIFLPCPTFSLYQTSLFL